MFSDYFGSSLDSLEFLPYFPSSLRKFGNCLRNFVQSFFILCKLEVFWDKPCHENSCFVGQSWLENWPFEVTCHRLWYTQRKLWMILVALWSLRSSIVKISFYLTHVWIFMTTPKVIIFCWLLCKKCPNELIGVSAQEEQLNGDRFA